MLDSQTEMSKILTNLVADLPEKLKEMVETKLQDGFRPKEESLMIVDAQLQNQVLPILQE